jgi:hypothetical protein
MKDSNENEYFGSDPTYGFVFGEQPNGRVSQSLILKIESHISRKESIIVVDSMYEIMHQVYMHTLKNEYKIVLLDFNSNRGDSWNPLTLPYKHYKKGEYEVSLKLLNDFSNVIFRNNPEGSDPFWDISSRELLVGLSLLLFEIAENEKQVNLKSIFNIALTGFERFMSSTYLKEYFEETKGLSSSIYFFLAGTLNAPKDTQSSILSVFYNKLRSFTMSDQYDNFINGIGIDIEDFCIVPTIYFVQVEDERMSSNQIVSSLVAQVFQTVYFNRKKERILDLKNILFVFNDFLSLGFNSGFENLLLNSKKAGISLFFTVSNLSILQNRYGSHMVELIKSYSNEMLFVDNKDKINREVISFFTIKSIDGYNDLDNDECIIISNGKLSRTKKLDVFLNRIYSNLEHLTLNLEEIRPSVCFRFDTFLESQLINKETNEVVETDLARSNRITRMDELIARIDKRIEELQNEIESEESTNEVQSNSDR